MRLFSYAFPSSLDAKSIVSHFQDSYRVSLLSGVIHFKLGSDDTAERDIFVYPFGAVVAWGLNEEEENKICRELEPFFTTVLGSIDIDRFSYEYGNKAAMNSDVLVLPTDDFLYKFACSYAFAQSVKLGGFEELTQSTVERTRSLPAKLAKDGTIHLSKKEISRLMGHIYLDRHSVNLHLELLDFPDFFWEHADLEPAYQMIAAYVDMEDRVKVLNQRLQVLQELTLMLTSELNSQHSSRLEWIIILLILVEVLVTFGKDIFHII